MTANEAATRPSDEADAKQLEWLAPKAKPTSAP